MRHDNTRRDTVVGPVRPDKVRLRYADAPVFLDVSSIVASYAADGQVDGSVTLPPRDSGTPTLGGYGRFTTRPTISYAPLTGDKFAQSLLRPIAPASVFQMIQAGYPADFILGATTRAINGHYNRSSGVNARDADADFIELTDRLRHVQRAEGLGMRIERRENGVADTDMNSKRAFAFMMVFFSLAETGTSAPASVLTIGAN